MNRTIFITGATSGIGKACAEIFAASGDQLIINGRREDRLQELKLIIEKKYKTRVWISVFDVRDKESVFKKIEELPEEWKAIDVLINNAGLALGRDHFEL